MNIMKNIPKIGILIKKLKYLTIPKLRQNPQSDFLTPKVKHWFQLGKRVYFRSIIDLRALILPFGNETLEKSFPLKAEENTELTTIHPI